MSSYYDRSALDSENARRYASASSNTKQSSSGAVHKLSKQLEVTVHTAFEEHQLSPCDAYPVLDKQLSDKPDGLSLESGVESREGKTRRGVIDI